MEQAATREEWAKRIERWKDSGLTAKEFATELGVSPRSLVWWRWRLAAKVEAPAPQVKRRRRRDKAKPTTTPPVTFVEMPGVPAAAIEVVLPSTIRIRVGATFDSATFERVLDVLAGRR